LIFKLRSNLVIASRKHYDQTRRAIRIACDALLFRANPALDRSKPEDRFVLKSALNEMVWKYSEATPYKGGKYLGCAWWSEKAMAVYRKDKTSFSSKVILEHVFPRSAAIKQLMMAPDVAEVRGILDSLETCVILQCEHTDIPTPKDWESRKDWWERYRHVTCVPGPNVHEES